MPTVNAGMGIFERMGAGNGIAGGGRETARLVGRLNRFLILAETPCGYRLPLRAIHAVGEGLCALPNAR